MDLDLIDVIIGSVVLAFVVGIPISFLSMKKNNSEEERSQ